MSLPRKEMNDKTFCDYFDSIRQYSPLSREEEQRLARAFRDRGDKKARERLITSNLRFVVKIALEFQGYGLSIIDLIQGGNIGLVRAVENFDPDRHIRLISYAVWWIRAYQLRFVVDQWSLVKIGTTQAQRKIFFSLRRAQKEIAKRDRNYQGYVCAESLAREMKVKPSEVEEMASRINNRDLSLNRPVDDASLDSLTYQDLLENMEPLPDAQVISLEDQRLLRERVWRIEARLDERERLILLHRLLADKDERWTLGQIGEQIGISRERIRQVEKSLKERLALQLADLSQEIG